MVGIGIAMQTKLERCFGGQVEDGKASGARATNQYISYAFASLVRKLKETYSPLDR